MEEPEAHMSQLYSMSSCVPFKLKLTFGWGWGSRQKSQTSKYVVLNVKCVKINDCITYAIGMVAGIPSSTSIFAQRFIASPIQSRRMNRVCKQQTVDCAVGLFWYWNISHESIPPRYKPRRRTTTNRSQCVCLCVRKKQKKRGINKSCEFRNSLVTIIRRMTWVIKSSFTPRAHWIFYATIYKLFNHIKESPAARPHTRSILATVPFACTHTERNKRKNTFSTDFLVKMR